MRGNIKILVHFIFTNEKTNLVQFILIHLAIFHKYVLYQYSSDLIIII